MNCCGSNKTKKYQPKYSISSSNSILFKEIDNFKERIKGLELYVLFQLSLIQDNIKDLLVDPEKNKSPDISPEKVIPGYKALHNKEPFNLRGSKTTTSKEIDFKNATEILKFLVGKGPFPIYLSNKVFDENKIILDKACTSVRANINKKISTILKDVFRSLGTDSKNWEKVQYFLRVNFKKLFEKKLEGQQINLDDLTRDFDMSINLKREDNNNEFNNTPIKPLISNDPTQLRPKKLDYEEGIEQYKLLSWEEVKSTFKGGHGKHKIFNKNHGLVFSKNKISFDTEENIRKNIEEKIKNNPKLQKLQGLCSFQELMSSSKRNDFYIAKVTLYENYCHLSNYIKEFLTDAKTHTKLSILYTIMLIPHMLNKLGISHNDLHMENIIVINPTSDQPILKIIDFDKAKTNTEEYNFNDTDYTFSNVASNYWETINRNMLRKEDDIRNLKHYSVYKFLEHLNLDKIVTETELKTIGKLIKTAVELFGDNEEVIDKCVEDILMIFIRKLEKELISRENTPVTIFRRERESLEKLQKGKDQKEKIAANPQDASSLKNISPFEVPNSGAKLFVDGKSDKILAPRAQSSTSYTHRPSADNEADMIIPPEYDSGSKPKDVSPSLIIKTLNSGDKLKNASPSLPIRKAF